MSTAEVLGLDIDQQIYEIDYDRRRQEGGKGVEKRVGEKVIKLFFSADEVVLRVGHSASTFIRHVNFRGSGRRQDAFQAFDNEVSSS